MRSRIKTELEGTVEEKETYRGRPRTADHAEVALTRREQPTYGLTTRRKEIKTMW